MAESPTFTPSVRPRSRRREYFAFLNKVDPNGDNPVQPFTGVTLWNNNFSPVLNPLSGEINLVTNAAPGTHYQLAASYWANKPLVNANMFDFAYSANSLYNGTTVAIDNSSGKSPLGYRVKLQSRYVNLSTDISTGMYDLDDSSYPFFQRLSTSGYEIPSENEWVKAAYPVAGVANPQNLPVFVKVHGGIANASTYQLYTMDPAQAAAAATNPNYTSEGMVFTALPPSVGSTNFRQFYDPETGAYAYSAADADVQFFTSRGYTFEGYAWSVD